jgi:hypothetical protein
MSKLNKVFDKVRTVCCLCDTPLVTPNLYERNGKYYCAEHYEKTSPEEELGNKANRDQLRQFKKLFQ